MEWGHLKAGDRQYGDAQQYEMVGDEVLAMLPPPPPPTMTAGHNGHLQHAPEPAGAVLANYDVYLPADNCACTEGVSAKHLC